jgi:hypothetical protein
MHAGTVETAEGGTLTFMLYDLIAARQCLEV